MSKIKFEKNIKVKGLPDIKIRVPRLGDMRRIRVLYAEVYGGNYSVPLIVDENKMRFAIDNDFYYWLVAECDGRIIASLIYAIDYENRISKAFGAVVSKEYRKHNLAYLMMKYILDAITHDKKWVDLVYATTRTANYAPQRLTESLGFLKLGIFPNTHKVFENETHCLWAYYTESALRGRKARPVLLEKILPFYDLVRNQVKLDAPAVKDFKGKSSGDRLKLMDFETIDAEEFIKHRFFRLKPRGFFRHTFMPFHEPNILLVSPDQKTEIYLSCNPRDKYSVILGGKTGEKMEVVLESLARKLNAMNMGYVELILDAYTPILQHKAMMARFVPSGYFPAAKKNGKKRLDCVVFSRTFEILDFRNVQIIPVFRNFLKQYLRIWEELYIDTAFQK